MSATIFVEGGGSQASDRECRAGFRRLWERCGFRGRLPRVFPSGGRNTAFEDFNNHTSSPTGDDYVGLLVDSEDPVADPERPWDHLRSRDGWVKPTGAEDDQALLMTTCMETWIAADREALRQRYPRNFNENPLPALSGIEGRPRNDVFNALRSATNDRYSKGKISFELIGRLNPDTLEQHLPSFQRVRGILNEKLGS